MEGGGGEGGTPYGAIPNGTTPGEGMWGGGVHHTEPSLMVPHWGNVCGGGVHHTEPYLMVPHRGKVCGGGGGTPYGAIPNGTTPGECMWGGGYTIRSHT